MSRTHIDRYAAAAIVLAAVSAVYWSLFSLHAYNAFDQSVDEWVSAVNAYFDLNSPQAVAHLGLLQFLVSGTHIAPTQLLLLPIFYLWQSPLCLSILQDVVLSATGLIVFGVASDLLGDRKKGLLMCIAFLVGPGVWGTAFEASHVEALIAPLYILSFYFYMKTNRAAFFIAVALLLGTMEDAPILVMTMCMGLLLYERSADVAMDGAWRQRRGMAYTGCALAVLALLAYNAAYYSLAHSYSTAYANLGNATYGSITPSMEAMQFPPMNLFGSYCATGSQAFNQWEAQFCPPSVRYGLGTVNWSDVQGYVPYLLLGAFLAYGFAATLGAPAQLVVFSVLWLMVVSTVPNAIDTPRYLLFLAGGVVAATILGYLSVSRKRMPGGRWLWCNHNRIVLCMILASMAGTAYYLTLCAPELTTLNNALLQTNATQGAVEAQFNSMMLLVPDNASLMVFGTMLPHVLPHEMVEALGATPIYFKPEYILVSLYDSSWSYPPNNETLSYAAQNNYSVYARNGTAILFKENANGMAHQP